MQPSTDQLIIYGTGAHYEDMLRWHPDLAAKVARIIDKSPDKIGHIAPGVPLAIESPQVLAGLPYGTEIAVTAIRCLEEIRQDLQAINPGLVCKSIDEVW